MPRPGSVTAGSRSGSLDPRYDSITVQCRLDKTVLDIYVDALSQLDILFRVQEQSGGRVKGHIEASGEVGFNLLAKLASKLGIETENSTQVTAAPVGRDINDLRHIAEIIKESGKRLIIEDFHYLSVDERRRFAFDLKALWDYGLFVVIIGVWSQSNMLLYFNPDLSGRVEEVSIYWSETDLKAVMDRGGDALNIHFGDTLKNACVQNCFGNVGILQKLVLMTLDAGEIEEACDSTVDVDDAQLLEDAALSYADQLNSLYQQFAKRVSSGIRTRKDSTGIYAHAMAIILDASDSKLMDGISADEIYDIAHSREPRVQKGNLKKVLDKFEELQVDDAGRGLVLVYNEANTEVSVVDRQLLLYRKYCTVRWPWEELISEALAQSAND